MRLLADHLAPALIGRDAERVEAIWRDLLFRTHATTVGAITALALAAIDTALWDLRCRKAGLPLHVMAGGAQERGAALHDRGRLAAYRDRPALVEDALAAQGERLLRLPRSRSAGRTSPRTWRRLAAVRDAVGAGFEIMTDANQAFTVDEAIRRARHFEALDLAWFEEPLPADDLDGHVRLAPVDQPADRGRRVASTASRTSASICSAAPARSCRSTSPASAASRPG